MKQRVFLISQFLWSRVGNSLARWLWLQVHGVLRLQSRFKPRLQSAEGLAKVEEPSRWLTYINVGRKLQFSPTADNHVGFSMGLSQALELVV